MKNPELQLLIYGKDLKGSDVSIDYAGINVRQVYEVENPNYLFVDLYFDAALRPGKFDIVLTKTVTQKKGKQMIGAVIKTTFPYELKVRDKHPKEINSSDLVYLIMPDRFSNGDPSNDKFADMADPDSDRNNPFLRHGGDLLGIQNHLDYLSDLGVTTL